MNRRRVKPPWWRGGRFLSVSVLGHAVFILVAARTCRTPFDPDSIVVAPPRHTGPIDVTMIEPTVLNPYATRPTPEMQLQELEKKVEEARQQEEKRDIEGQVVDVAKPDVEIRPDDSARFLSEYDTKVEKETKGKAGDERAGAKERKVASAASRATPPQEKVEAVAPQAPQKGQGGASKGTLAMRSRPKPSEDEARGTDEGMSAAVEEGSEARKGETAEESPADEGKGAPGENRPGLAGREGQEASPGSPDSLPQVSDLRPSDEMLSHAVGGGSSDYLKDVDEGADTLLNTKRWKYASFFTRVKRGVAQSWRPDNAYRLRDPTGQIYGHKNRFTVLKVSLRPDGSLRDVLVEKGSGVDFLDDEAVSAFREAQPFPNPPPGLVDPDSKLITFRFGFYFEIVGTPTFKIFRQ